MVLLRLILQDRKKLRMMEVRRKIEAKLTWWKGAGELEAMSKSQVLKGRKGASKVGKGWFSARDFWFSRLLKTVAQRLKMDLRS